jgi:hypothetical protein
MFLPVSSLVISESKTIRELGAEQNACDEGNGWSAAFTRLQANCKAAPLSCWQLFVSLPGGELRPEQFEHDSVSFVGYKRKNI